MCVCACIHTHTSKLIVVHACFFPSLSDLRYGGAAGAGRLRTIIVVSCCNLVTGRRHVMGVLRKHVCCRCGCKGWCSLYPLLSFVRWSIDALAEGKWPDKHPDRPWRVKDGPNYERAGSDLGFRGAVQYVMADWEAICNYLGFPSWSHKVSPCPLCSTTKQTMHEYRTPFLP